MGLEPLVVPGENQDNEQDNESQPKKEQDNENQPSKEQDHDNLLQNTIQDVVSEVLAVVDEQHDVLSQHSLPEPNEESDSQHSTEKDLTEESSAIPFTSPDQDVNNLHPTVHYPSATTDVHSRSSEAESSSENGKIISLDLVEAEWDHESDDAEGERFSEDSNHSSKVVSSIHAQEQGLKDMSQPCKFLIWGLAWIWQCTYSLKM